MRMKLIMMEKYLLGIDIGTSACKVATFRINGEVVSTASEAYPVYYPKEGWAEQDPNDWWSAVCKAIHKALVAGGIKASKVAGIGVAGQSWSAIALDKDGKVLTNTPIWMDTRAQSICHRLNQERPGGMEIFKNAGNYLNPSYSTAKILWYEENLPEVYREIDKIMQSNGYIVYQLTGRKTIDKSQAYGIHSFDMRHGVWNEKMCKALGIPRTFLPEIKECSEVVGEVSVKAARETGLAAGTPVVAGGLDAACGTLGAGVVKSGETQEQGGQAGGMSICLEEFKADPRLILSYHVVPGKWLLQGGTTGGGGTMRWFENEFADHERHIEKETGVSSLTQLNEYAKKVPAGSEGMVFLPYMSGERSPIWNPYAKGVYYGLDFAKTKGHFVRATMEGVAYALRHNLETAKAAGADVTELLAVGGAANSILWTQIKADVTGKRIKVPASDTATTLGAAILAGVGTHIYADCEQGARQTIQVMRIHEPDKSKQKLYDTMYQLYLEIYDHMKDTMKRR